MSATGRKTLTRKTKRSRKLAGCSDSAFRLWVCMYVSTDNYGTTHGEPWDILQECVSGHAGWTEAKVKKALRELVDTGLIEWWRDDEGRAWAHVSQHDKNQTADFLRKRGQRYSPIPPSQLERCEAENPANNALAATTHAPTARGVAHQHEHEHTYGIEESTNVLLSDKHSLSNDTKAVFDHWINLTWSGKGRRPKFSAERKNRIRARLADGFTADDLRRSLDGFNADPFYNGDNDTGRSHMEIAWRMKNAAEVERGIALAEAADNQPGRRSPKRNVEADIAAAQELARQLQGGAA